MNLESWDGQRVVAAPAEPRLGMLQRLTDAMVNIESRVARRCAGPNSGEVEELAAVFVSPEDAGLKHGDALQVSAVEAGDYAHVTRHVGVAAHEVLPTR